MNCSRIAPYASCQGRAFGPYEIVGAIGAGGMGEVYRAHDPRVGRDVAIKVSADRFSEHFEREVRAIAALNHPNICTLHDVGPNYLVMELVEGESPRGPLPPEEALRIGKQIADALEAAHEKGIVHRDLKPANVKVKPDGMVKVLDFGLATHGPTGSGEETRTLTSAGTIVGTAAYMSPEQARGKTVDRRTDIWAFGVVLYELITGRHLFQGETVTDVLAAVVTREPDWKGVPPRVQRLLKSCLERDPKKRLRDIGDAWRLLEEAPVESLPVKGSLRAALPYWAVAGVLAAGLAALAWLHFGEAVSPPANVMRLEISLPENLDTVGRTFVLSPDGRTLALNAVGPDGVPRLWVRSIDSMEVRPLAGAETTTTSPPFIWSPDSKFIAFTGVGNSLRKVDLIGSPPQTLVAASGSGPFVGGSWNREGVIVYGSTTGPILKVAAAGGKPEAVTSLDSSREESRHAFPVFLPDGKRFFYTRTSVVAENSGIFLGALEAAPDRQSLRQIAATPSGAGYVPAADGSVGRLLFQREGTLFALPFDEARGEATGDPVPLAEGVGTLIASGLFSASQDGLLIYRSTDGSGAARLTTFNRRGLFLETPQQPNGLVSLNLSPDGSRAAVVREDANRDLWVLDFRRATTTRLMSDGRRREGAIWTPDGASVVYVLRRDGVNDLHRAAAEGGGTEELLFASALDKAPTGVSADGQRLLFTENNPRTKSDIWVLAGLQGPAAHRKAAVWLATDSNESQAQFSPGDSRWVAYTSDESGRNEVYVREAANPAGSGKWAVSLAGGSNPRWRGDGRELYFAAPDGTIMAAEVTPGSTFQANQPKALFRIPAGVRPNWDVTPDGQRFLMLVLTGANSRSPLTVLLNWEALLKP